MKATKQATRKARMIKVTARMIVDAILSGAHTEEAIKRNQGLVFSPHFDNAIEWLEDNGIIEQSSDNLANESGYFMRSDAWMNLSYII